MALFFRYDDKAAPLTLVWPSKTLVVGDPALRATSIPLPDELEKDPRFRLSNIEGISIERAAIVGEGDDAHLVGEERPRKRTPNERLPPPHGVALISCPPPPGGRTYLTAASWEEVPTTRGRTERLYHPLPEHGLCDAAFEEGVAELVAQGTSEEKAREISRDHVRHGGLMILATGQKKTEHGDSYTELLVDFAPGASLRVFRPNVRGPGREVRLQWDRFAVRIEDEVRDYRWEFRAFEGRYR